MSAYVILDIEVTDPERYEQYKQLSTRALAAFGGRFAVRGGRVEVVEGNWSPHRVVVLEFESVAQAKAWYDSPEYQKAKAVRQGSSRSTMILVEGPQTAGSPPERGPARVPRLSYLIRFVDDMDRATAFYRDTLGLPLKFQSPEWTEFLTGETTLALHPASAENPAGTSQLGFQVPGIARFHRDLAAGGVRFTREPEERHGTWLAEFVDSESGRVTVSGS